MAGSSSKESISKAGPHTVKSSDLIEESIKPWAQKLMRNQYCNGIIFIDCLCRSGRYHDENGVLGEGTPIRAAKALRDAAGQYPLRQMYCSSMASIRLLGMSAAPCLQEKRCRAVTVLPDG